MNKKINQLLYTKLETEINGIKINSKQVTNGDLFVCIKTRDFDRHDFIDDAINNGAAALVVAQDGDYSIPYVVVENPTIELITICQNFYDNPQDKLKIIGITGTDGKTSCATIIQQLLGKNKCGMIGTFGVVYGNKNEYNGNTTPDATLLYKFMREILDHGCEYLVMEASSEGFLFQRLEHLEFDASIITNLAQDHLNNHKTMENYISCKQQLFKQTKKTGLSVLNKDDLYFESFKKVCNGKVVTYGKDSTNDFYWTNTNYQIDKTSFIGHYKNKEHKINSPLPCDFNVYNLSAALLCLLELGFSIKQLQNNLKGLVIEGRMQSFKYNDVNVIVDYAHTPNGLSKLFSFITDNFSNHIISVSGSAGDRDSSIRYEKGQIILNNSDYTFLTSEDPRFEDPLEIAREMAAKISKDKYEFISDRETAITKAITTAPAHSLVLILGKGHEKRNTIAGVDIPFCDIDVVKKITDASIN